MRKFSEHHTVKELVLEMIWQHQTDNHDGPTHIKIGPDAFIQAKHEDKGTDFDRAHAAIPSKLYGLWIDRADGMGILEVYSKEEM